MYSKTITLRPNGSLTLPKKMRDKHKTIHYIAIEVPDGVLLKPVSDEIEYYENEDGSFGLRFPNGIEAGTLAKMMRTAMAELDQEEKLARKKKPRHAGSRG
jgi:hypothetical protein